MKLVYKICFSILLILTVSGFVSPVFAQNQTGTCPEKGIRLQISIPIPGLDSCQKTVSEFTGGKVVQTTKTIYFVKDIETYIAGVYRFFIGAIALSAVVMMMIGGFQYILAAGNQQRISSAKSIISGALGGLVLSLLSYTLLNTINPRIVELELYEPAEVGKIARETFCENFPNGTKFQYDPKANSSIINKPKQKALCGRPYFVLNEQEQPTQNTCLGKWCEDSNKTCVGGECVDAMVHGEITFSKNTPPDKYITRAQVVQNCPDTDGKYNIFREMGETEVTVGKSAIAFAIEDTSFLNSNNLFTKCGSCAGFWGTISGVVLSRALSELGIYPAVDPLVGSCDDEDLAKAKDAKYYLGVEINEVYDPDDWFIMGKDMCQSGGSTPAIDKKDPDCDQTLSNPDCTDLLDGDAHNGISQSAIELGDLKAGFECNLNVVGTNFVNR